MAVNAANAAVERLPITFAGFPAGSWLFAVRIWLAVMLALYVSFWLELDTPSSAAVTVAILALPTRGQGMEKAGFRLFATIIGVAVSIAIAGAFSQTDVVLLGAFAVWTGLCVYAAGVLDGNRAYAAALGIITVALIAIQQIDSPQLVFPTGVARGAALAVGVLATALVNDVLAAPDYHPIVAARLEALYRSVLATVENAVRGETISATMAGTLLRDITILRPEIASLVTESSNGDARSAAARAAMVDLVTELLLARALAALTAFAAAGRPQIASPGLTAICRAWLRGALTRKSEDVLSSLEALRAGTSPGHRWRAPLYRSRRIAAENGVRAAIHFALVSAFFVIAGWPSTAISLSLVAIIIGLASTTPDPRAFIALAVVATPSACLLSGILKYYVFNGVSEFPLLAIGLAPLVIGLALLITLPKPLFSSLGRLTLVFTFAILAPTNPQSYDPTVFVITCLLATLAAILAFVVQLLVPPMSSDRRLAQLLKEACRDLRSLDVQRHPDLAPEEAAFHDAARIAQIITVSGTSPSAAPVIGKAIDCFERAAALRLCGTELDALANGPLAGAANAARISLAGRNGNAMLASAEALLADASQQGMSADPACATLVLAGVLFTPAPSGPAGSIQGRIP